MRSRTKRRGITGRQILRIGIGITKGLGVTTENGDDIVAEGGDGGGDGDYGKKLEELGLGGEEVFVWFH